MYSQTVWEHLREPQNRRHLPEANAVGDSRFPKCNDHLIIQLRIEEDTLKEACFLAKACGPVVAVASVATGLLAGLSVEQARQLTWIQIDQACGGLPPPKRHALWLLLEALHIALDQHQKLNQNSELTFEI